jgi:tetratricopeptide (TPR) repeat protein
MDGKRIRSIVRRLKVLGFKEVPARAASYVAGVAIVGVLAVFGVPALLGDWLESLPVTERVKDWIVSVRTKPMKDGYYNILIANLASDDSDSGQTEHVRHSLEVQFDATSLKSRVRVQRCHCTLRSAGARAEDTAAALAASQRRGHRLVEKLNADVMVWGEVARSANPNEKAAVRLRFLPRYGEPSESAKSYTLNEVYELSENFGNDVATMLAGLVAARIPPALEEPQARGQYLADVLEPAVSKLAPLAETPPRVFSPEQVAELRLTYCIGAFALGRQWGDRTQLMKAVQACHRALEYWTPERAPDKWAETQNILGGALTRWGVLEHGTARLEEAVAAFREALKVWTPTSNPTQWGTVQNNLANALFIWGNRETGSERLLEAIAAYRGSLQHTDRTSMPLDWALTKSNIGNALTILAERESEAAHLEEAIAAFIDAGGQRVRERVPLDWATTQHHLGSALRRLGEVRGDNEQLMQAVAAFNRALEERTQTRAPLDRAISQHDLAKALKLLGDREPSLAKLIKAREATEEALGVFSERGASWFESQARQTLQQIDAAIAKIRQQ